MDSPLVLQPLSSPGAVNDQNVSAVFIVAFFAGRILAIRNERGWDLPGGHVEPGESPQESLRRELMEEAGAMVAFAIPCATLAYPGAEKVMLFFAGEGVTLGEFVPREDALGRELIEVEELITRYYGDRALLRRIIDCARDALNIRSAAPRS